MNGELCASEKKTTTKKTQKITKKNSETIEDQLFLELSFKFCWLNFIVFSLGSKNAFHSLCAPIPSHPYYPSGSEIDLYVMWWVGLSTHLDFRLIG